MGYLVATIGLSPLLLVQGFLVRRGTPRLPEPEGEREGTTGSGPRIRLLVLGDSAAAGVGAGHQDEALLGQLVRGLASRYRVHWTLHAQTGATTTSALDALRRRGPIPCDVVVTSLGVNDVTSGVSRSRWRRRQAELRSFLRHSLGASDVVLTGLPPMHEFPALPQPLRWYLGQRAKRFDRDLRRDAEASPGCSFLPLDFVPDVRLMARDGFHPGPEVYALWAQRVVELLDAKALLPEGRLYF